MPAPSPTHRTIPVGYKMPNGWQTEIVFANFPGLAIWEKEVKPPGLDGGEAIDTTTMLNQQWRTKFARSLKTATPMTVKAAYDPETYFVIIGLINANTVITVWFPDNSSLCFWGFLEKFEYDDLKEGEFPMANVTITPTNEDNSSAEQAPVFTPAAGTP